MMELDKLSIKLRKKSLKYLSQYGTVSYINKRNIVHNSKLIIRKSKNKIISPVIKADAYGIGAKILRPFVWWGDPQEPSLFWFC